MALTNYEGLNALQLDALREIGNIGSGNAASALSTMLDYPVTIAVPAIKILDYDAVVQSLGGPEQLLVGILLSMSGDATGMIMFLLHKEFVSMALSTLTGVSFDIDATEDEMSLSAIREIGNIMAASYVTAMSEFTGLNIKVTVPSLCIDMAGSILSVPTIYYANISDKIILIEDEFNSAGEGEKKLPSSHILLIPDVESLKKIMASLGLDE
ncbi:MAG: chemotaxis protein CheC [Evtepia sp.]